MLTAEQLKKKKAEEKRRQQELDKAANNAASKDRTLNDDFTIRIAKKYAVIIEPGSKEFFIDLKTRRCSCGVQNCVHLHLIGIEHENELKSA